MNVQEALLYLESLLPQFHLNKLQIAIFQQVWENCSYLEIAKNSGYGLSHIKQTGSELWQLLSNSLGEKVNKTNVQSVLKRHAGNRQIVSSTDTMLPLNCSSRHSVPITNAFRSDSTTHCDWGEAADVSAFWGRVEELQTLERWIVGESLGESLIEGQSQCCRLIGVFGMGGIGKTTLSIRLAQWMTESRARSQPFEFVIWRSLKNTPSVSHLVADWIQIINPEQSFLTEILEVQIRILIHLLKYHRCLLIIDSVESVLRSQDCAGNFQPGYEGYGELLTAISEMPHQSCLVLTSREKPTGFAAREGPALPVRSLQLTGLSTTAVQQLLSLRGNFFATETDWQTLTTRYSGNPLVLKIVAGAIADFFGGNVAQFLDFLQQNGCIFADIRDLLNSQFQRLTLLERKILHWLAIRREPASLVNLPANFISQPQSAVLLEALVSLERRCFLERTPAAGLPFPQGPSLFKLQPVVLDYVIEQLTHDAADEIVDHSWEHPENIPKFLSTHSLNHPSFLKTHTLIQ